VFRDAYTSFQFSLNPSWNYRFFDKCYAGAGVSPTIYLINSSRGVFNGSANFNPISGCKFDMPVTAKVGYDFKFLDVSLGYSHGLFNIAKSDYITKAKLSNWHIQVFIPF
jgi:hypothetical protein